MPTEAQVIEQLKLVKDPELGFDVYTLGLIYKISISEEGIDILMTLTSPFCPFGDKIVGDIERKLHTLHSEVRVEITFDPEWTPTEEIKMALGV